MAQKVLLYTSALADAEKEIKAAGGSVPLQLSDRVLVAVLADDFNVNDLKFSTTKKPTDLEENSAMLASAWEETTKRIDAKESIAKKEMPLSWDDKDHEYPRNPQNDVLLREQFKKNGMVELTPAATSQTLNGKVAVGILIVSGPTASLQFTSTEYTQVVSEVLEGLFFLATCCYEANLNFTTITYNIPITAMPICNDNTGCQGANAEACENVFRNPALTSLGYPTGNAGCTRLTQDLKTNFKTQWAYITFFAKYPMYNFAYSDGVSIYMQYDNDGWKPDQINKVFAHETCHMFGAADEYAASACTCAVSGIYNVPNNNCVNCAYTPKVICLMNNNDLTLCNWSRGQVGWGYWNLPFKSVGNNTSSNSPSITCSSSLLYIGFNGKNDNSLYTMYSQDGVTWSKSVRVDSYTAEDSPSLGYANNLLFIAWRGDNSSQVRVANSSNNGSTWIRYQTTYTTTKSPALTFFNSKLFVAWVDKGNSTIQVGYSSDNGKTFIVHATTYVTSNAPAIISFNNKFYLAWVASDNYIHITNSPNGIDTWTDIKTNFKTNQQASLAVFKNRLYLSCKDADSSNIFYGSSADGTTWGNTLTIIDSTTTNLGPSITGFTSNMFMTITDGAGDVLSDNFIPGVI